MSNQDDQKPKKKKGDLTSLFDLSDFDHTEDPETEAYFKKQEEDLGEDNELEIADEETLFDDDDIEDSDDSNEQLDSSELTQTEFNPEQLFDSEDDESQTDENQDTDLEQDFESNFEGFDIDPIDNEDEEEDDNQDDDQAIEPLDHPIDIPEQEILKTEELVATVAATNETLSHYEKFDDIQKFAKNSHYGPVSAKGEPPFSMIIEGVKYKEDASKILAVLKEYGFLNQSNEMIISKGLERGSAIISRVSEFAVIFLYSKLSQLPIKLKVGPSDLIFASSSSEHTHQGSVGTDHLLQNREDSKNLVTEESSSILFSSQSEVHGYNVQDFLGHCFESIEFQAYPEAGDLEQSVDQLQEREIFNEMKDKAIQGLKDQLQKIQANAGIDFEIQTQALFTEDKQDYLYQITAKCNAVWIKKA